MSKENTESFKENYEKLEEIVQELSDENKDIDESIELFKEGIKLYNLCKEKLNSAQEEVVKLLDANDEVVPYEE